MHAVVLDRPGPLDSGVVYPTERADPVAGPGQIVVQVGACGVCRSNLHMIEGDWVHYGVPAFTPIIPGHEVVGRVAAVGPDVDWLHLGDRVGVQPCGPPVGTVPTVSARVTSSVVPSRSPARPSTGVMPSTWWPPPPTPIGFPTPSTTSRRLRCSVQA